MTNKNSPENSIKTITLPYVTGIETSGDFFKAFLQVSGKTIYMPLRATIQESTNDLQMIKSGGL